MDDTLLLIDGMYLVFSSFYANPSMRTLEGTPTGAVFGFISRTENLIQELKPQRLAVTFDSKEKTFRHELYPEYKGKRLLPPDELIAQLPFIHEYLDSRGIRTLMQPGLEGDDLIALLTRRHADYSRVVIFSADKDLFQLVGKNVFVYHPKEKRLLDPDGVRERYGIGPEQVIDFLSLAGDSSDNIPGVPGIGEKTALKLLAAHGTVERMLAREEEIEPKARAKIDANRELLELSHRLLDLSRLPSHTLDLEVEPFANLITPELIELCQRLSFNTFLKRFAHSPAAGSAEPQKSDISYQLVRTGAELDALRKRIGSEKRLAIDIETTAVDFTKAETVGLSIGFVKEGYYIPLLYPAGTKPAIAVTDADFASIIGPLLADPAVGKTGHNLKFDMLQLRRQGLGLAGVADDTMLMSYLLFPNRRSHQLKELTLEYLKIRQLTYEELVGKGKDQKSLAEVAVEDVGRYCIDDSVLSLRLAEILRPLLEENGLTALYRDIEVPLVEVLADMEYQGVKIDTAFLKNAAHVLKKRISALEKEIHDMAGYEFNLNSSRQLGELLFVKMNLPVAKKTRKTKSFSTDIDVLTELKGYPLVGKIIEYRTLKKLQSTYVDGLLESVDENNRVHTSFNQTVTATGRLSSSNPNLQNIPVGEMGGIHIRRAFVAEPGNHLLAADYSQIELRVMAHFSQDPELIEAFRRNEDIHWHTAELVFGENLLQNPEELRRRAKIINFSIIYGSGAFSLSKELEVPVREAKAFIDGYFEKYRGVKRFMDEIVAAAEKHPQVSTIAGRQRPIPEIQSANRNVKENGNRMAINTVIQGSAADIIKKAMIAIHRRLRGWRSRLIMQVHDELVFECHPSEEKRLCALVQEEMEHAFALRVPLKVSLKKGPDWGDLKPISEGTEQ